MSVLQRFSTLTFTVTSLLGIVSTAACNCCSKYSLSYGLAVQRGLVGLYGMTTLMDGSGLPKGKEITAVQSLRTRDVCK